MKAGTTMGVVKRTLKAAIRKWEARKLMTAHISQSQGRKRQMKRAWPHPLTSELRAEFHQGVRELAK